MPLLGRPIMRGQEGRDPASDVVLGICKTSAGGDEPHDDRREAERGRDGNVERQIDSRGRHGGDHDDPLALADGLRDVGARLEQREPSFEEFVGASEETDPHRDAGGDRGARGDANTDRDGDADRDARADHRNGLSHAPGVCEEGHRCHARSRSGRHGGRPRSRCRRTSVSNACSSRSAMNRRTSPASSRSAW